MPAPVFHDRAGVLCCEEVPLDAVADAHGTPAYVYSAAQIRANVAAVHGPLRTSGVAHDVLYAVKANGNPAILSLLASLGVGADVVSGGELEAAIRAGIPPSRISYAGVGKTDREIFMGLAHGIAAFSVESAEELEVIAALATKTNKRARIGLRINPEIDARTHPYISTGLRENKFGVPTEELDAIVDRALSLPHITLCGIHTHIGSQIADSEPFAEAAAFVVRTARMLQARGVALDHVNIGGGFAVDYGDPAEQGTPMLTAGEILGAILPPLAALGVRIVVEPGRALVANAGALLTRVIFTKQTATHHFTIVDAGMNDLIRPALYEAYHEIRHVRAAQGEAVITDVVGPVCETSDFLGRRRSLVAPRRGDLLAVLDAGAYGYAMGSTYTMRARPVEVLVDGAAHRCVRERTASYL